MKIRIMKQEVLDTLKGNLETYMKNYYQETSNDWIYSICECDPFEDYKEIKDFQLADPSKKPSEIDFENCKIVYSNLAFLTESQACDERLWAGLTHDVFYKYMRDRYKMKPDNITQLKNPLGNIKSRFFYKGGISSGRFRNALAKCWWVGHHTWNNETGAFDLLDKLGRNDMSTKVTDIFHNYTFINNREIMKGIIEAIYYFNSQGISFNMIEHVRPALQYLNAIGGGIVLDMLHSDDIRSIMIEQIQNRLNGLNETLINNDEDEYVNNENKILEAGDTFRFKYLTGSNTGTESGIFKVSYDNNLKLTQLASAVVNLHIGDVFETILKGEKFSAVIIEINKVEDVEEI